MKKFIKFYGTAKKDFRSLMIHYWMKEEGYKTEEKACSVYGGDEFDKLCERVTSIKCEYIPDLGYKDKEIDGTLCFEKEDNDFPIPIDFISIEK